MFRKNLLLPSHQGRRVVLLSAVSILMIEEHLPYLEDGESRPLRNLGTRLQNYTYILPRRP
jgi:hypothetical protein